VSDHALEVLRRFGVFNAPRVRILNGCQSQQPVVGTASGLVVVGPGVAEEASPCCNLPPRTPPPCSAAGAYFENQRWNFREVHPRRIGCHEARHVFRDAVAEVTFVVDVDSVNCRERPALPL
jgi:hypothetical protein